METLEIEFINPSGDILDSTIITDGVVQSVSTLTEGDNVETVNINYTGSISFNTQGYGLGGYGDGGFGE